MSNVSKTKSNKRIPTSLLRGGDKRITDGGRKAAGNNEIGGFDVITRPEKESDRDWADKVLELIR